MQGDTSFIILCTTKNIFKTLSNYCIKFLLCNVHIKKGGNQRSHSVVYYITWFEHTSSFIKYIPTIYIIFIVMDVLNLNSIVDYYIYIYIWKTIWFLVETVCIFYDLSI